MSIVEDQNLLKNEWQGSGSLLKEVKEAWNWM